MLRIDMTEEPEDEKDLVFKAQNRMTVQCMEYSIPFNGQYVSYDWYEQLRVIEKNARK